MAEVRTGRAFFFSSRRRHTRSKRDWSSDVCSSDLSSHVSAWSTRRTRGSWSPRSATATVTPSTGCASRSEERRVGKECRSWRTPLKEKKKMKYNDVTRAYNADNVGIRHGDVKGNAQ